MDEKLANSTSRTESRKFGSSQVAPWLGIPWMVGPWMVGSLLLGNLFVLVLPEAVSGQVLRPQPVESAKNQDGDPLRRLTAAARRLEKEQKFDFKYNFKPDDVILWQVEHAADTETRIQTDEEKTSSRSQSVLKWQIAGVDSLGNTTIMLTLAAAKMWQQVDEQPAVEFDSRQPRGEIPEEYRQFAEWIGVPMATYQIDRYGNVIDRKEVYRSIKFGVGDITMPLPGRPVSIGQAWHVPGTIHVRTDDGTTKPIRTRIEYRLQAVADGIARVSFDTQVLTPVDDARIESQLIQQMSKGEVLFDLNRGQMVGMNLGWDRRCLGFKGPESLLKYVAKYSTRVVQDSQHPERAAVQVASRERLQPEYRLSDDNPIFRW